MNLIKSFSRVHGYFGIYQGFLRCSPDWSPDRRDAYVIDRLRRTLVRAAQGTSYYRRVFRDAGFDPSSLKEPSDLSRIPLLTKETARASGEAMTDRRHLPGSIQLHTSGTTGEPLHYRWSEYQSAFDSACIFRHWSWAGYTFRAPMVALRSYVPEAEGQPLWRYSREQNTMYFSAYHLTPKNCQQYIEEILKFKPRFMKAYPSSMVLLAEYAYPIRDQFQSLQGIFTASETLLPSEREIIERTFGRKLFNWYGMGEPAAVFTECEKHDGMHWNWEYGLAEFLPSPELGPNEHRLVTTNFHNSVMPFIRYDTGDVVRLLSSPRACACGRNMPLIDSVSGRKDECIITPDGRRLPSVNFYTVFRKYSDIAKWQIVQYGRAEVVAKVSLLGDCNKAELERRLIEELRLRTGPEVDLFIDFTDRFVTNPDGKTLPIVRKLAARAVEEREEYAISSQRAWQLANEGETVYKLDWNEADQVPSPRVQQALKDLIEEPRSISWYPEAGSLQLRRALANYTGLAPDNILVCHGSDAAMELMATTLIRLGDTALIVSPTYDNFRAVVEQRGAEVVKFDYRGERAFPTDAFCAAIRNHSPRVVYVVNPNNPIGYALNEATIGEILGVCARLSTILVIDEAYYEFCGRSCTKLIESYPQLIVTRTLSKAFGLAGLRLGYVLAAENVIRVLLRVYNPKSVTSFAKTAALAALEDADLMKLYVDRVRESRERLYALLDAFGILYYKSEANFVLLRHEPAPDLVSHLESRGVLVRDRTRHFDGAGHVRITIGGSESTDALLSALTEYFGPAGSSVERSEPKGAMSQP
jgi:histidinol-phosphate aminotransferase